MFCVEGKGWTTQGKKKLIDKVKNILIDIDNYEYFTAYILIADLNVLRLIT